MDALSNFLQRFQKILGDKTEDRKKIQQTLKDLCGVDLEIKNIQVRGDCVFLSLRPLLRSEVFLKRDEVIKSLKQQGLMIKGLR